MSDNSNNPWVVLEWEDGTLEGGVRVFGPFHNEKAANDAADRMAVGSRKQYEPIQTLKAPKPPKVEEPGGEYDFGVGKAPPWVLTSAKVRLAMAEARWLEAKAEALERGVVMDRTGAVSDAGRRGGYVPPPVGSET